jgi:hypothetical protein
VIGSDLFLRIGIGMRLGLGWLDSESCDE